MKKVVLERTVIKGEEYWIGKMPDNSYGIFVWEQKGDHWEMSLIDIQYDEKDNDITGDTGYHLSGGRL